VYIRRIFERQIDNRFAEFKTEENWSAEDFQRLRVAEKIELLKDHLPDFLVKNRKLYGILSLGIHELDEADCLNFFSVIRASTIFILEEDKRNKDELAQRATVEKAIEQYVPPKAEGEGAAAEATKEPVGRISPTGPRNARPDGSQWRNRRAFERGACRRAHPFGPTGSSGCIAPENMKCCGAPGFAAPEVS
jgi:hypothetical protein